MTNGVSGPSDSASITGWRRERSAVRRKTSLDSTEVLSARGSYTDTPPGAAARIEG
ncbi:MAG: hypothetical protein ACLR8Y_20275 [Alistipes indistinctus]